MSGNRPSAITPYLVALGTLVSIVFLFSIVASLTAALSGADNLSAIDADELFGSAANTLVVSACCTATALVAWSFLATWLDLPAGTSWTQRLPMGVVQPRDALIGLIGLAGVILVLDGIVTLLGLLDDGSLGEMRRAFVSVAGTRRLFLAIVIGVLPGVGEELFFRGYLLHRMKAAQGVIVGIVASSVVFGLFHMDPVHTGLTAVMGLYLAALTLRCRSLLPAMVGHALNNIIAALSASAQVSNIAAWSMVGGGTVLFALSLPWLLTTTPQRHTSLW